MLNLDPPTYPCPTHTGQDLTPQVRELLEEQAVPVAFGKKPRPFEVLVSCPGAAAGEAHELACRGRYWR